MTFLNVILIFGEIEFLKSLGLSFIKLADINLMVKDNQFSYSVYSILLQLKPLSPLSGE
ncbi:hypothetical protein PL9631_960007 [Planktothrix paucivesiculata PCC 9631]|uniref:Uncharacterized protein n=1 Tax=Planktothrix paucivesiculata PCC 9631 TaxID=671071 RepID=A0A7Z9E4T8_9CYAN|nr:hypothetical protein PL9631_960007 [Planktothrix paucivesiculata PCC 9631]